MVPDVLCLEQPVFLQRSKFAARLKWLKEPQLLSTLGAGRYSRRWRWLWHENGKCRCWSCLLLLAARRQSFHERSEEGWHGMAWNSHGTAPCNYNHQEFRSCHAACLRSRRGAGRSSTLGPGFLAPCDSQTPCTNTPDSNTPSSQASYKSCSKIVTFHDSRSAKRADSLPMFTSLRAANSTNAVPVRWRSAPCLHIVWQQSFGLPAIQRALSLHESHRCEVLLAQGLRVLSCPGTGRATRPLCLAKTDQQYESRALVRLPSPAVSGSERTQKLVAATQSSKCRLLKPVPEPSSVRSPLQFGT